MGYSWIRSQIGYQSHAECALLCGRSLAHCPEYKLRYNTGCSVPMPWAINQHQRCHVVKNRNCNWSRWSPGGPRPRSSLRARIILLAYEGKNHSAIARELGVSRPTVLLWRGRFSKFGVAGILRDAPRPGCRKAITAEKVQAVVEATL